MMCIHAMLQADAQEHLCLSSGHTGRFWNMGPVKRKSGETSASAKKAAKNAGPWVTMILDAAQRWPQF